ncbi:hypothetical protein KDU71_22555 [Carboxylicivirga sediminis]|uniref:PA domain-containing protein n=1 Tax=Carboxylicivirga sediminis TaxID=2006564 RepID=A0A941FDG9_9BACT|nr:PA domain-containing protein [Carboxylicivirga sediminis]MBR8538370.1 hypothetical protein [Carboxylicivirga sediminis]
MRNILFLSFILLTSNLQAQDEEVILKYFHSITSEEVFGYAKTLAEPQFDGRLAGSPGYTHAAEYVADYLKEWDIQPGFNGSYFKHYPLDYTTVKSVGSFTAQLIDSKGNSIDKSYSFPEHYYPGSNSGNGEVSSELVYVGYGITAPEHHYDDYKGIDVKNKIVMLESGHPKPKGAEDWNDWAAYAGSSEKMNNALQHGAQGVLFIYSN